MPVIGEPGGQLLLPRPAAHPPLSVLPPNPQCMDGLDECSEELNATLANEGPMRDLLIGLTESELTEAIQDVYVNVRPAALLPPPPPLLLLHRQLFMHQCT